jgi:DUF917 family protein
MAELVRIELTRIGEVPVHDVADLPEEALCLPVAQIGSSTRRSERLPVGDELPRLMAAAEREHGRPVGALAWLEAAGSNLFVPLLASALTGIPLVDADGMGRAYSSIVQTSYEVHGVPASPVILVGATGETIVIRAASAQLEPLVRPAVETLGGWAMAGWYAQPVGHLRTSAITGTLERAYRQGRALLRHGAPQEGRLLLTGRVTSIEQMAESGRSLVVTSAGEPERFLRIVARDVCLLALLDGQPVAAVPQIISVVSHGLGRPVNVEDLSPGQSVDVWAVTPPSLWTTQPAAGLVGPRAHGLKVDL